jgi:hypothetical protein
LAPTRARGSGRVLSAAEAAWIAAIPTAIVSVLVIAVLGPPLGSALLAPSDARFWPLLEIGVRPEPTEQARFLLALAAPLLLAALTVVVVRLRPSRGSWAIDVLVVLSQVAVVGFVGFCVLRQKEVLGGALYPPDDPLLPMMSEYFSFATLLAAAAGTVFVVAVVRIDRLHTALSTLTRETRVRRWAAAAVAVVAIAIWLLHAVFTEGTIGAAYEQVSYHLQFLLDETFAVLDGRAPLVNYVAQYGSLLPYGFAAGMSVLGDSVGVWVALALCTTGVGMLAIFLVLRGVAQSSIRGLLLFLPVLATSFFMVGGTLDNRYTFGNYFGTFPMRYAGPSVLALLVVRHLEGHRPRHAWMLFLAAGIVVLNNLDVGVAALGATVAALIWAGGQSSRGRLLLEAVGGLALALVLVALLTLAYAGELPHLELLLRYSRLFASAGFGMFAMPTIGLHLVIYLTYVAALAVATVRAVHAEADRSLTAMLTWSGVFGLGTGAYFVGRSTPDDLPAMFFPWSFSLALLLVPAFGAIRGARWRHLPIAATACVFGFLVMACSLAQTPTPWGQLDRLQLAGDPIVATPAGQQFVTEHSEPGEPVAILLLLGHRIGANSSVVNVAPYSNSIAIVTSEQLDDTIAALRAAGGTKVFVNIEYTSDEMLRALEAAGFWFTATEPDDTAMWVDSKGPGTS